MKFSKALIAAATGALIGSAIASPVHLHNVHKREAEANPDVVTVTVWVSENADAAPTADSAPAAKVVASADSTESATEAAATTSASSSSSSGSSSGAGFGAGAKGVTYSPYSADGQCKSASDVASDLAQLTGFEIIRIYGVDCNQVSNVYNALAPGQKLFAGLFDLGDIAGGIQSIHDGINGDWSVIHTVSVGNELVNSGQASVDQIAGYVSAAKSALSGLGYSGPVVSVDTFIAVINNPGLCEISDYIAVNAHAFFDGNIVAGDSGPWVLQQIQRVWTACGGTKNVMITETGWPSAGDANGVAIPSDENQAAAISSIKATAGDSCILFTAFNDYWKHSGPYNAEQFWGIMD